MFRRDLFKDWGHAHLPYCGWYLDCTYDISIQSEREFNEKFGETNLEKATSIDSNLKGVKQNQSAKRVRKLKKQLAKPSSDNLDTKDFIKTVANEEEGATQDFTIKTLTTHKHLHNMSLDLSLEDSRSHSQST